MQNRALYLLWAFLFALCAGLGFIPSPSGALYYILMLVSLGFFVPPAILLYRAAKQQDRKAFQRIRNLSLLSLGVTLVMLILNFMSVAFSTIAGIVLYRILIVVSAPMVCSQIWALSLFLWGCLLTVSLDQLWKHRKKKK